MRLDWKCFNGGQLRSVLFQDQTNLFKPRFFVDRFSNLSAKFIGDKVWRVQRPLLRRDGQQRLKSVEAISNSVLLRSTQEAWKRR